MIIGLVAAGIAVFIFGFISVKTVWAGYQTTHRREEEDPAWKQSFKLHRFYGKRIWMSLGLLIVAVALLEAQLRHMYAGGYSDLVILHLLLVALFVCNLLLLHVSTGLSDPAMHRLYGALYIALFIGLLITGGTLYLDLLYKV